MADYIEAPTMGEILREEYMIPIGITDDRLARDMDVPVACIQNLMQNRERVSAGISERLGNCFGVSEQYFLNLQNAIDSRRTIH